MKQRLYRAGSSVTIWGVPCKGHTFLGSEVEAALEKGWFKSPLDIPQTVPPVIQGAGKDAIIEALKKKVSELGKVAEKAVARVEELEAIIVAEDLTLEELVLQRCAELGVTKIGTMSVETLIEKLQFPEPTKAEEKKAAKPNG